MSTELIQCSRGTEAEDVGSFELDTDAMLSDVRDILTTAGFLAEDDLDHDIAYRFVNQQTESSNLKESLIGKKVEQYVPLKSVFGPGRQLILTNEYASHKPDLIGISTDWCTDRNLSVRCVLNYDPVAKEQNDRIGAIKPLMLHNVVPTSLDFKRVRFRHVCVCVSGTALAFDLSSWGAAGFEFFVGNERGEPFASDIFQCFDDHPDRIGWTSIRRWQKQPNIIVETMSIAPGKTFGLHKIIVKTRRLTSYKRGDRTFSSNTAPPPTVELQAAGGSPFAVNKGTVVPGGSVKQGTVGKGSPSKQNWGGVISSVVTDDWSLALGYITLYMFVFRSHAEAKSLIDGYNAPVIRQ